MIGADDPEYAARPTTATTAAAELYMYAERARRSSAAADPRDDIVTKLLNAEIDGEQLTELEFDMFILLLAVAGNETTRNATARGMRALMQNPDQFAALARRPDGCSTPPSRRSCAGRRRCCTSAAPRRATPRSRGQEIKAGDKVVIWYISANRDEDGVRRPVPLRHRRATRTSTSPSAAAARTSASAPTSPAWSCSSSSRSSSSASPTCSSPATSERLRSNFIGGIKHMPVTFTPGARRTPPPLD